MKMSEILITKKHRLTAKKARAAAELVAVDLPYLVNEKALAMAHKDCVILHCLPAHYGEEIEYNTSRRKGSAIFDQAENRLHAEKALMVRLADKS